MEQFFELIIVIAFGAIFGSYATLFAYRLPRGESCFGRYFGQKSRCPNCNSIIKTRDLIPLINWIITFGKCRNCHVKIPRTHLFVEFFTTLVFVLCYLKFSFSEAFILHALIGVCLVILLACDFTHKTLPAPILILITILIVAIRASYEQTTLNIINSGALAIIFSAIFYKIFFTQAQITDNQKQFIDYIKFILCASLGLGINKLLFYFFALMLVFSMILFIKKARNLPLAYALIIPFIAALFI